MSEARAPLRRSRSDRVFGGICGGLGEFFGIKPLWFRIVFVILGIPGGLPGIVPYILLWLIVPEQGSE
jgi:phage shock protein PspC (stress-responsive transcriptional regulator)